jgi:hypothetical protein
MAPSGNRFDHDHSPEFTSIPGSVIGGELYISKAFRGAHQVSEIGIFQQFCAHYVHPRRALDERTFVVHQWPKSHCVWVERSALSEDDQRRISFDMTVTANQVLRATM